MRAGRDSTSPSSRARLVVRMKPRVKVRSPDLPPSQARRTSIVTQLSHLARPDAAHQIKPLTSTLANPLTSTQAKPLTSTHLTLRPARTEARAAAEVTGHWGDISGIRPMEASRPLEAPRPRKGTVARARVKSPAVGKVGRRETFLVRDSSGGKSPRTRVTELWEQVKKKDAEIVNLTRKVNALQKTLGEKDKSLKDLEIKIPKMLTDLRKNLEEDEMKKRMNRDLRDTMKRNRNLSGNVKQVEDQLRLKEGKLKDTLEDKRKVEAELKVRQRESREAGQRAAGLERQLVEMERRVEVAEGGALERERRAGLEARCLRLVEENSLKEQRIEKMKEEVVHFSNEAAMKERQLEEERRRGVELQEVVVLQERRLGQQVGELEELRRSLESRRGNSTRCQEGGALQEDCSLALRHHVEDAGAAATPGGLTYLQDMEDMEDMEYTEDRTEEDSLAESSTYSAPSSGTVRSAASTQDGDTSSGCFIVSVNKA